MNMAGRVTWVHFVLSAIPIYVLIAINVAKLFIKAIDKLRRAFTWKGRQQVNGFLFSGIGIGAKTIRSWRSRRAQP